MKKLLVTLLAVFAISASAQSKENITIFYSWSASDGPANYSRSIAEEANKIQNKYNFIVDYKPGAGGTLAANHVNRTPNTVLATASAFFVRPNFFPTESYDINAFKTIFLQCTAPMAISSVKYKSLNELPMDQRLTIGVSGLGTTTHLFATQFQAKYPLTTVIPFKSTSDSLLSAASGSTDLHVAFLGEVEAWSSENSKFGKLNVLGISGTTVIRGFPTLAGQGFGKNVADISVPFHFVVPTTMTNEKFTELRNIFIQAGRASSVKETYKPDACVQGQIEDSNLTAWYRAQSEQWKRLSTGIKLD